MEPNGSSAPARTPKTKRTRRGAAKSRQGCARCKARRKEATIPEQDRSQPHPDTDQAIEAHSSTTDRQLTEFPGALEAPEHELDSFFIDLDMSWLTDNPSAWEVADLHTDASQIDDSGWKSMLDGEFSTTISQHHLPCTSNQGILQAPVHWPTILIEHWFRYICPMRSTFDSEINYNRQLAWNSWSTSEAVFYMMQVMSVAYLMTTMPQLRDMLPSLKQQATLAIDQAMSQVRASLPTKVTADLVFAVFGLGTSSPWVATAFPDQQPWLEWARELLSMWKLNLSPADALIHVYFCQALTYWEMLATAIGRGSMEAKVDRRRRKYHSRLRNAMNLQGTDFDIAYEDHTPSDSGPKPLGTRPNSWCGLSNEVIDVFGQVLALCRSVCYRDKKNITLTLESTSNALCDISVALELQRELLAMDFETLVLMEEAQGYHVETQDDKTPLSHLLQTAEAYRQAALLQLYLTFYDLDIKHTGGDNGLAHTLPGNAINGTSRDEESRARSLTDLTLQLVAILEKIPAESGSKFIHPMLYLSAAAGLGFGPHSGPQDGSPVADWTSLDPTQPAAYLLVDPSLDTSNTALASSAFIPQLALEVSRDRSISTPKLVGNNAVANFLLTGAEKTLRESLKQYFPEFGIQPFSSVRMCWYQDTPGGDFMVDYHPDMAGLFFATGDSGHMLTMAHGAFKFLSVLGKSISDCIESKASPEPREKWMVNPASSQNPDKPLVVMEAVDAPACAS
ncbi:hypothetical protein FDECE_3419 [Fusarium decemcellulare]|nr:hypothetical protein FDECE_3419 [Fusarium decemcellulare]